MKKIKNRIQNQFKDSDKKEILSKGFSFLVFSLSGLLSGYFYTLFIAQKFGASINGLIGLSFSIFMISSIIGRLGLDMNLVKFYSSNSNVINDPGIFYVTLLKSFFFSSGLSGLIYIFRVELCIDILGKPQLLPYLFWTCLAIPLWVITLVCASYFRARRQNNMYSFLNGGGRFFLSFLFLIILYNFSKNPIITIQAHFYALLILSIISLFSIILSFKKIQIKSNYNSWVFLRESFPMMLSSTLIILLGWLDIFILGIFETDEVVGVYTIALKVATLTSFSLQAINSILAPKIAKAYEEKDLDSLKKVVKFSTKINFFITFLVVLNILFFRDFILTFFGEEFKEGSVLLIILCIGQFINSFSGSVGIILQMTGLQNIFRNVVVISLFINILLNFLLTPIYGAIGVAFATVISMALWNIMGAIYLKRKLGVITYYTFR